MRWSVTKSESKPMSSTARANSLMPRARSAPSPSHTYDGRNTPNRSRSVIRSSPPLTCVVFRWSLAEERCGAFEHVLGIEDSFAGVKLGGEARVEIDVERQVDEFLRLAHGNWAACRDLLGHGHGGVNGGAGRHD